MSKSLLEHPLFNDDSYFGLSDLEMKSDHFDLGHGVSLSRTYAHLMRSHAMAFSPAPPGQHHPAPWVPVSGGDGFDLSGELVIPKFQGETALHRWQKARAIQLLLRIRVNPATTIRVLSSSPFSQAASKASGSVHIYDWETRSRWFGLTHQNPILEGDAAEWIKLRWLDTYKLLGDTAFSAAAGALEAGQFEHNTALTMVSLWGSLEALFDSPSHELSYRVSSMAAAFLEEPGPARLERQKSISKLYNQRSAAAHGKPTHKEEHLTASFNLLKDVVTKIIEVKRVPTRAEYEGLVFGVPLPLTAT